MGADSRGRRWVGTWAASPQPVWEEGFTFPTRIPAQAARQTVRQIVRVSLGGTRLKLRLSNEYGMQPLHIGAATVVLAADDATLRRSTLRALTFGGQPSVLVPAGAPVVSDPVPLDLADHARLAVSLYLPDPTPLATFHWDGRQTAHFGDGDLTAHEAFQATDTTEARLFLSGVLVETPHRGAVAILGDSITDGAGASLDADTRWPDHLARRLAPHRLAVLNAGISGARLLQDRMGVNAPARFTRDVLAHPGVTTIIVLLGINDIGWPGTALAPAHRPPPVASLQSAYRQLIAQAHAHNLTILGATLPPFEGALAGTPLEGYHDPKKDALRQELNHWIRDSGAFDAVIDFDARLRDPAHPGRLAAAFDCGDHLHPGDSGGEAMADAVDLDALLAGNAVR